VIVDLDRIAAALTIDGASTHSYGEPIKRAALAARRAAVDAVLNLRHGTAWVIDSAPRRDALARYIQAGAHIVDCDPGRDVVLERAQRRPEQTRRAIAEYYARKEAAAQATTLAW
jgi:hypothetical protein